jgi:hypothetical protein
LGTQGLRTLFCIECKNGKPIGSHSYFKNQEQEVILLPGSCFEVLSQLNQVGDPHIIHLRQIDPPGVLVKPPFTKLPPTLNSMPGKSQINKQFFLVPNVDSQVPIKMEHKSVSIHNSCDLSMKTTSSADKVAN